MVTLAMLLHREGQALEHRDARITMSAVRYLTSFAWRLLGLLTQKHYFTMIQFRDYQEQIIDKGVNLLHTHGFAYLSMEVRTGKTLTALGMCDKLSVDRVLFLTKKKAISSITGTLVDASAPPNPDLARDSRNTDIAATIQNSAGCCDTVCNITWDVTSMVSIRP